MREIKFRAWDGEQMHYNVVPWQWDFVISKGWHRCEKSTGDGILGSGGKTGEFLVPGIRFTELMQYTGLKDKNGKEIYEGDIIAWDYEYDADYDGDMPIVKRSTGKAEVKDIFDRWQINEAAKEGKGVEVIGNIYENAELLKNDKERISS